MFAYADGAAEGLGFWHGIPILLGGGQRQVINWAANKRSGANLSNHFCTGDASARQWDTPVSTNLPGQTGALVDLGG